MGAAGAPTGVPKAPKGGIGGATPPEGEGNPAEGGSLRVYIYKYIYVLIYMFMHEIVTQNIIDNQS